MFRFVSSADTVFVITIRLLFPLLLPLLDVVVVVVVDNDGLMTIDDDEGGGSCCERTL